MRPTHTLSPRRLALTLSLLLCCALAGGITPRSSARSGGVTAENMAPLSGEARGGPVGTHPLAFSAAGVRNHGLPAPGAGSAQALVGGAPGLPLILKPGASVLPAVTGGAPYGGTPVTLPGTVEAENFDDGGEGVAYHDNDPGNNFGGVVYRDTSVDVGAGAELGNGYAVGYTTAGEWLGYTVQVAKSGTYDFKVRYASAVYGGTFHLEADGVDVTGQMAFASTGSWGNYATVSKGVSLSAGTRVLRLVMDTGGTWGLLGTVDYLRFDPLQTSFRGPASAVPGTLEAEDFDEGGEAVAYHDLSAGNDFGAVYYRDTNVDVGPDGGLSNGYALGYTCPGEWTEYTVDVAAAGTYDVSLKYASAVYGGTFHLEADGVDVTGQMAFASTGSWGNYQAVTKTGVALTAGRHVLRLSLDTAGSWGYLGSVDYLLVERSTAPAAPTSLTAAAASNSRVDLTWADNSSNETGFKVERKAGAAGTYAEVAQTGAGVTTYADTGLQSGTQYLYRVRAAGTGGDSAYSNEAGATTQNTPPTVSLTAPAAGAVFVAPADITLAAAASDGDGTVQKVQFFQGGTQVCEDADGSDGYGCVWSGVTPGTYTLKATAVDNGGAQTTSAAVSVTVVLPTVTVTASDAVASEQGPDAGTFTITRTGGTVSALAVSYSLSGTATNGTDYNALPGSVIIPAGSSSQIVTVTPVDDAAVETGGETVVLTLSNGAAYTVGSPAAATVTIADDDTNPPTASVTSPAGGTVFTAPAGITIEAAASDQDGTVTKVEFFQGGTKLGEDTTAPYSFTWANVAYGSYSLTAKATDNAGATGTSSPVDVVVNAPPSAAVTAPAGGALFTAPATFTVTADASDADGSIARVEFFRGSTLIGEDSSAPYSLTWAGAPAGTYALSARATDSRGASTTSTAVSVMVNAPPAVSITGPADGSSFDGSNVTISASATDADGSVNKVEFYDGATKLGEDTTAPYAFTWMGASEGAHTLTAVATDDRGAQATSASVAVSVVDFAAARLDPRNRTGAGGVDLYSRNFNWSLPLVSLPGRAGLDLGLSLSYNSLVWTKSGNYVLFDGDGGWPAPGFRLGFPVVQAKFYDTRARKNAYMLVTSSGARVSLRQTATPAVYEAGNSSYLQLKEEADGKLTLATTGGTRMTFEAQGGVYKCARIKDRNGNFITAGYNASGNLESVTDTLGRTISFGYNAGGYLEEITQVWHREEENGPTTKVVTEKHYWARFYYDDKAVRTNFAGLTVFGPANNQTIHALTKVKLSDDSSFTFNYTTWGQVNQVSAYAPDNRLLNYVTLDLPADETQPQADCPRPSERRDWAAYWNGDADGAAAASEEAVTSYEVTDGATWTNPAGGRQETGRRGQVTAPDGTVYKEYAHSSGWDRGLVRLAEFWSGGVRQKWTGTAWTQDDEALQYEQNPRVTEANVYDKEGNRRRTEVTHTSFGLPQDVKEYDADAATVLRRTHTEYVPESVAANGSYTARRIIGLPSKQEVYGLDGGQEKLFSKVTYEYDLGGEFLAAPEGNPSSVAGHDPDYLGAGHNLRGNLNRVRRWDVTDASNQSKSAATETGYDRLGSAVFTCDALQHKTVIGYADSDGGARLAYPTKVTDPELYSSTVEYDYDNGAVRRAVDQRGAAVRTFYDAAGRRLKVKAEADGAYTSWEYGASGLFAKQLTKMDTDKAETFVLSVADGAGRVRGTLREMADDAGGYSARRTEYDRMGRPVKLYNAIRVSAGAGDLTNVAAWQPAAEDAPSNGGTGWVYTRTEYDWKGRVRREVEADGTTDRLVEYEGCGCAGGEVITVKGESVPTYDASAPATARRTQKVYHDVLGRVVKAETLNWDGSVYSTTTTLYDALDRVARVRRYAGPLTGEEPAADGVGYETTRVEYDGHGRPHTRHLPGQSPGTAMTYDYNEDDTVKSVTDARGVKTEYEYYARHLVKKIKYNVLGVASVATDRAQGTTPVAAAPDVTYTYDGAGNRLTMATEQGLGGSATYHYDALSRLDWEERTLPGLTGAKRLSYEYTLMGALRKLTDVDGGKTYTYDYDGVGRMAAVKGTGFGGTETTFATLTGYRAWGAPKGVSYGNGVGTTFAYSSRGLVTRYRVTGVTRDGQYGPPFEHGSDIEYYADGRVKYASDLFTDGLIYGSHKLHDRAYSYDQEGRLKEAYSGSDANQFLTGTGSGVEGAYRQSYGYDAWGNQTSRAGRFWTKEDNSTEPYAAGASRHEAPWEYDADGRFISRYEQVADTLRDEPLRQSYDAAGRPAQTTQKTSWRDPVNQSVFHIEQHTLTKSYDGDSLVVREATGFTTTYYLRSSALGGQAIAEYDSSGARQNSYAVAGAGVVVRGDSTGLYWRQTNPVTGDELETNSSSAVAAKATTDPEGVALGDTNPFDPPAGGGEQEGMTQAQMNSRYAQLLPPSMGGAAPQANVDGFQMNASLAFTLISMEAASVRATSQSALPIYSRSRQSYVGLAVYNAQAAASGIAFLGAGSLGYLPAGTTYQQGVGLTFQNWFTSVYPGTYNNFLSEKAVQVTSYIRQATGGGAGGQAAPQNNASGTGVGQQLSQCLRDALRQFYPQQSVQGKNYSPIDDARFESGIPAAVQAVSEGTTAITLGLYDISYDPSQVNLSGGSSASLQTILEEVAHTEQFLQVWAGLSRNSYLWDYHGEDTSDYRHATVVWEHNYTIAAAKGRYNNGDSYKNDIEKWAKNKTIDISLALLNNPQLKKQGNLCGFDLTHLDLTRPNY